MSYVPCMGWGILGIKDGNLEWCMLLFYSNKVFINIGLELDKHYSKHVDWHYNGIQLKEL